MFSGIIELVKYLLSDVPDIYKFSEDNDTRIVNALLGTKDILDHKYYTGTLTDERMQVIWENIAVFIPWFQQKMSEQHQKAQPDTKFMIGYIALSIWADPNNPTEFDLAAPHKDIKRDGTYTSTNVSGGTQCNHFAFMTILKATGQKMTKGESVTNTAGYGMMGAGVYFGNDRNVSEAAIEHLSQPVTSGEFGDIISFSKDDSLDDDYNDFLGSNHVGIYMGNDLYVSASGTGISPIPGAGKSVVLGSVHYHAHYCSVH